MSFQWAPAPMAGATIIIRILWCAVAFPALAADDLKKADTQFKDLCDTLRALHLSPLTPFQAKDELSTYFAAPQTLAQEIKSCWQPGWFDWLFLAA